MGSIPPELSLDVRTSYTFIPKTIADFLGELAVIGSVSEKSLRLDEFVKRLEEEMRKIDAFKRELPLCMLLLNDAIVTLKEESVRCRTRNVEPVLEEFIPLKKNCDEDDKSGARKDKESRDKMNWMRSVQLWNSDNCKNTGSNYDNRPNSTAQFVEEAGEECGLVDKDPFPLSKNRAGSRRLKDCSATRKEENGELTSSGLSLVTPGIKDPVEVGTNGVRSKTNADRAGSSTTLVGHSNLRAAPQPHQQQIARKQRRCWSPELHRRFVSALQQLGGSQVATPKQIRELMQVDGLTNDEVKSHLQKYRLHSRRLPTAKSTPADQAMVVLGGLWMPQEQHGESSKQTNSQSGSPQGPLQLSGPGGGTSTTCGESLEEEEEERSESYGWKSQIHRPGKDNV